MTLLHFPITFETVRLWRRAMQRIHPAHYHASGSRQPRMYQPPPPRPCLTLSPHPTVPLGRECHTAFMQLQHNNAEGSTLSIPLTVWPLLGNVNVHHPRNSLRRRAPAHSNSSASTASAWPAQLPLSATHKRTHAQTHAHTALPLSHITRITFHADSRTHDLPRRLADP